MMIVTFDYGVGESYEIVIDFDNMRLTDNKKYHIFPYVTWESLYRDPQGNRWHAGEGLFQYPMSIIMSSKIEAAYQTYLFNKSVEEVLK